jgi:hypothetical protein
VRTATLEEPEENRMNGTRANTKVAKALAAFAAAAALAAGGAAVSGCGASATLDPVARAAEVSSEQGGARFSLATDLSSPALPGGSVSIVADGYLDERNHAGELNLDLSNVPGVSALTGGAGTMQMRFVYPVVYMHAPFLAGKLPEGKTWVKLDLRKAAQAAGVALPQLSSIDQTDPTQFLEYLRASSGGVSAVGTDAIDGVAATHYRATLQLGHIVESLPASERASAKAALETLGGGTDGIPVDVWVDARGRVRRMQMSIGGAGATAGVSGTVTIDYTAYGPVPPVVPPPAGEVLDESSLLAEG